MAAYQSNGKPLSQQAIYQQKLKHGVFNSPGLTSVGVGSNASDTAALLAASSDLSVKPSYERLSAAPAAHTAAVAAKKEKPQPAPKVPSASEAVYHSYDKASVYKQAAANSSTSMTSRTTPVHSSSKHGLTSKASAASPLNIGKISQMADQNSSKTLSNRFNPAQDHRSGLASKPADLTQDEETLAAKSASASLSMKHGSGYTDSVSSQRRSNTFRAQDVVDATLLAAASAKANERLKSINSSSKADIQSQVQLYSKALVAAQKNSEARLKDHKAGMIDMGGGLSLPASEVDKLANLIVQPVLESIGQKATAQRQLDEQQRTKQSELRKLHEKFKRDDENRRHADKVQKLKEKEQRVAANDERKRDEDKIFADYQAERNTEVDGKTQELRELQAQYASEKEKLLSEKKANEDRINEEETGLINERKEELTAMQAERDEILAPTLEELREESAKLKELTDSKDQLSSEVDSGKKLQSENEAKIAELKKQLEQINSKIDTDTREKEQVVEQREASDKDVAELHESSKADLEQTADADKQLDQDLADLKKQKQEHISTKASNKKEILQEIEDKVKGEKLIQRELPEHLQEPVNEDYIRDTGSLFSVERKEPEEHHEEPVQPKHEEHVAKPAAAPKDVPKKKGSLRSKWSGLKKSLKGTPNKAPRSDFKSSSTAPKADAATVASTLGKDDKLSDEEISIAQDKNKGGVFKEEI